MIRLNLKTMPLSTNQLYQGRRFLTKEGKANKVAIAWEVKSQLKARMPLKGPVVAYARFFWPDARNHDIENFKSLWDVLSGFAYDDDSQIVEMHLYKAIDRTNPRVEIEVEELSTPKI